jgi:N-methylhydantoinase A
MAYRLGVDVGGTFTDLFLVEDTDHRQWRVKTPSTPADPSQGVLSGVRRICEQAGIGPDALRNVVHGTTVATNAVLESKGARVGLITTRGFGQILHLARSQTPGPLAGWIIMIKPDPPASLADTREAVERMDARGNTLVPVDRAQVEAVVRDLIDSGVESLTISLINAYVDGRHEREIADIVEEVHPGFPVTISSDVLPEFREYERTLTACMNSYVRPTVASYVDRLRGSLRELGVVSEVDILRSDAGVMTPEEAARNPVYGVLSGPSGGVAGALYVAARAGYPNILTFDMGGTSTDVSLCQAGEPTVGRETTIGQFRIKIPSIDVHTVGAGGGSIAHVPELTGALRVGPESAGAEPGPAAYGRGGTAPTVTDANVVVGHLPPRLIGGEMELDVEAARTAVGTIADAMGLSLEQAAEGILKIVNENMAGALRVISVQRGHDPREFALVAFGGAGPLHANAVAELMGSFPVIVPPSPGLLCALGDLVADFRNEFARTLIRLTAEAGAEEVDAILGELEGRAREWMDAQGIERGRQSVAFTADMRYHGQGYEIPVPMGDDLDERFNALHEQLYGFRMPDTPSEIVNLRAVGTGVRQNPELPEGELHGPDPGVDGPVYDRTALQPGNRITGPAVITEFDSTTVVLEGYEAEVDRYFNILIRPEARA